jgi:prepilin-type processing-associated H-X9-DG protein
MPTALVIGAGIGGVAAGLALRRAGWDVRLFERADAPRELGFGLAIAPNAMAALREIGVADAVRLQAWYPTAAEIRRADGRVLRRVRGDEARLPVEHLPALILRPALHGTLLDAFGPVEVNREAVRFVRHRHGVDVTFADGSVASGDVLVGADGFHSGVRAQLHPAEPPPRPGRYFALRGASPAVDRLGDLAAIWYFGPGVESGVVRAGASTIYWFLSLSSDDVRLDPVDPMEVLRRWAPRFDDQFRAITSASTDLRLDELFERDPLDRWGEGPVTLLGDAAHPMLPYTGQGAAQALEDAAGLGRALHGGTTDPVAALRRYEAVRAARTRSIVRSGPRIARITTTRNPVISLVRNAAVRLIPAALMVSAMTRPARDPNRTLGKPLNR